jgi:hypothetical protein
MEFSELYSKAHAAGMAAGQSVIPDPMIVQQVGLDNRVIKTYAPVMDGVCGFAWVKIKGNTGFARWAKKAGVARSSYPNGLQIWVGEFNQSMTRKEAYAEAFATVLRAHGVVEAAGYSRMD